MRLIDADELLKILQEQQKLGNVNDSRGRAKAILEVIHAPTIDVEPVKHGYWIKTPSPYHFKCSSCKTTVWIKFLPVEDYKFCWHCGARMDGDTK